MADRTHKLVRSWLVQWAPEVRVHEVTRLGSGVSCEVYGVEYTTSRGRARSALRLVSAPLNLCMRESMVLNRLYQAGLPVSRCFGVKQNPRSPLECAMLLDWLPGQTIGRPQDIQTYTRQLASLLVSIHTQPVVHGIPKYTTELNRLLRQARQKEALAKVVSVVEEGKAHISTQNTLLHGDFWPGNILFRRKQLTGIVDWSDVCVGPPQADVSNARIELAWLWGEEAKQQFTEQYYAAAPSKAKQLAFYDLAASLKPALYGQNWGLTQRQLQRLNDSVEQTQEQALRTLGVT